MSLSSVPPPAPDWCGGRGGHKHGVPAPRAEPRRRLPRLHRVRARVPPENIYTCRKYLIATVPVVSEAGAVVAGEVAAELVVVDGAGAAVGLWVPAANIFI